MNPEPTSVLTTFITQQLQPSHPQNFFPQYSQTQRRKRFSEMNHQQFCRSVACFPNVITWWLHVLHTPLASNQPVEGGHDWQRQLPLFIAGAVHKLCVLQWGWVIEPLIHSRVLLGIQIQLNRLKGVYIKQVVCIVQGRLLWLQKGRGTRFDETSRLATYFAVDHGVRSHQISSSVHMNM